MNQTDLKKTLDLHKKAYERASVYFPSIFEKDTSDSLLNKLKDLEVLFKEIFETNNSLFQLFSPFELNGNTVSYKGVSIKLVPADPKRPISVSNQVIAKSPNREFGESSKQKVELERKLERSTKLYYQTAWQVIKQIQETKIFPKKHYDVAEIRDTRNKLIEPKKDSIVFDSFTYSLLDGPIIKGMRKNSEVQYQSKGLYYDANRFIEKFISKLNN